MIFLGMSCNLNISFMKIWAMLMALWVDLVTIKLYALLIVYISTMMESCCLVVFRNHITKFIDMTSHFHSGTEIGCSSPTRCLHYTLTC